MAADLQATIQGNRIELSRSVWDNETAYVSYYPGLLEELNKHTWTLVRNPHPYVRCSSMGGIYLHHFVLKFLYGEEKLNALLEGGNIIEHLDNDGLNCSYDNLHILSEDYNKAKAFTIDKEQSIASILSDGIPPFITDGFYSHIHRYYQLQITFNRNYCWNIKTGNPVEMISLQYDTFEPMFLDWLYLVQCRKSKQLFQPGKFHQERVFVDERPIIFVSEEEKNHTIIERDGKLYANMNMDDESRSVSILKSSFKEYSMCDEKDDESGRT